MKYGYARVSTHWQASDGNSLEAQIESLNAAGADKIYMDEYSGRTTKRPQLDELLSVISSGDELIVTKLDRMARSVIEGSELIKRLQEKKITVNVLNIGCMDNSPTGRLITNVMLSFAEFERDMIIERTQEGKNAAKRNNPDFKDGRPCKFSDEQMELALELLEKHSYKEVSNMTGISKSTLQRAKNKRMMAYFEKYNKVENVDALKKKLSK
ncbi:recombinase family protein [Eubacterium ventriosum]|jgi:DNA invertase Pin-like site-specific DNA recombinase|uniref:recombinase family protein n=1 Tax=Eubacterium ventriosum TaxID=39496 RepID=UPI00210D13E7|nr:recombinase family protein [Eubacterium ventriosum]MCQ5337885.1 recombinase family protein [Eubacterium ventriosum]